MSEASPCEKRSSLSCVARMRVVVMDAGIARLSAAVALGLQGPPARGADYDELLCRMKTNR
jgi:hypothetical protein